MTDITENFSENKKGRPQKYNLKGFSWVEGYNAATTRRGLIEQQFTWEAGRILNEARKNGGTWPDFFIHDGGTPKRKKRTILSALGRYYHETQDVIDVLAIAEVIAEKQLKAAKAVRVINYERRRTPPACGQ